MAELLRKILKAAEKYGNAELVLSNLGTDAVIYDNENLSQTNNGTRADLTIRLSKGKQFGFSTTNNLENWEQCVRDAYSVMKASKPLDSEIVLPKKSKYPKVSGMFSKKIESFNDRLVDSTKEMIDSAKEVDNRIKVPNASMATTSAGGAILTSNGIDAAYTVNMIGSSVETTIGEISGSDSITSRKIVDFNSTGRYAADLCVSSLNPMPIKTMKADLILNYFAIAEIIKEIFVPAFTAENVQTNKSFLKGKLGQEIFSKKLTIEDDALLKGGLLTRPFDSEGTASQKTILVKNGVIKNYLYDSYSARKDKVKSTGNCAGLQKIPYVDSSNFMINPGKYTEEKIISDTKEGVFAEFAFGAHVANVLTGDVSIGLSNAFYIKGGSVEYPIKQVMVSFNLFEALKNLHVIGNKLRQETNIAAPMVRFDDVQIIGS
jgi:PmbA protein